MLIPILMSFQILQSCSKDKCGCSFVISIDADLQFLMATEFISNNSDGEIINEPDKIRYKVNLPNECAGYIGETISVDTQGYRNGQKFGDEISSELLMTSDIIYLINGIKISRGVNGYTLISVGCN